jgi:hypothetical protein
MFEFPSLSSSRSLCTRKVREKLPVATRELVELIEAAVLLIELRKRDRDGTLCARCATHRDCGRCVECLDKSRFGGKGVRKRSCVFKLCGCNRLKHKNKSSRSVHFRFDHTTHEFAYPSGQSIGSIHVEAHRLPTNNASSQAHANARCHALCSSWSA